MPVARLGLLNHDGPRLVTEGNYSTGAIVRRYVHRPGVDEMLVDYAGAGTTTKRW